MLTDCYKDDDDASELSCLENAVSMTGFSFLTPELCQDRSLKINCSSASPQSMLFPDNKPMENSALNLREWLQKQESHQQCLNKQNSLQISCFLKLSNNEVNSNKLLNQSQELDIEKDQVLSYSELEMQMFQPSLNLGFQQSTDDTDQRIQWPRNLQCYYKKKQQQKIKKRNSCKILTSCQGCKDQQDFDNILRNSCSKNVIKTYVSSFLRYAKDNYQFVQSLLNSFKVSNKVFMTFTKNLKLRISGVKALRSFLYPKNQGGLGSVLRIISQRFLREECVTYFLSNQCAKKPLEYLFFRNVLQSAVRDPIHFRCLKLA